MYFLFNDFNFKCQYDNIAISAFLFFFIHLIFLDPYLYLVLFIN